MSHAFEAIGERVHADMDWGSGDLRLWFYARGQGCCSVYRLAREQADPNRTAWERREVKDGDEWGPPSVTLPGCAVVLQRALGEMGIEAESDSRVKGKLESMTVHLADMRALAFKALGMEKPEPKEGKGCQ